MSPDNLHDAASPNAIATLRTLRQEWVEARENKLDIASALREVWASSMDRSIAATSTLEGLKQLRLLPVACSGQTKSIRKKIKLLFPEETIASVARTPRQAAKSTAQPTPPAYTM